MYEAFREADGRISGVMAVATDVTEQVLARKRVEAANQELGFVTDTMPQLVWAAHANGSSYFFNKGWEDYTGLPTNNLIGSGWTNTLHPDDVEQTLKAWHGAVAAGTIYEVEYRIRRYDGEYRWFLVRGTPMKDENGTILKWYGSSTDVEQQKQAEEALEQRVLERTRALQEANNHLKRLNAELEQFVYISHHDLQEPLRKIILFSDWIKSDNKNSLTEASHQRLEKIYTAAQRMSKALRDVLDYASLEKEEMFVDVNLDDVIGTTMQDLELAIQEKRAKIHTDTLPTVKAIPGQMHQLFYNLVSNALKFSKPTEPPVIDIACKKLNISQVAAHPELDQGKPYILITVRDNGIGFTPQAAEKIFIMFQRLHSKDAYAGTGIGLALCKKVVANHQEKIWAEGKEGEGARFRIILPED